MKPTVEDVLAAANRLDLLDRVKLRNLIADSIRSEAADADRQRMKTCPHVNREPDPICFGGDRCQDCGRIIYDERSGRRD